MANKTRQRPQRTVDTAVIAPAVILLMVSNHFPVIYGDSRPGLVAPIVVAIGCLTGMSLQWMASRRYVRL
jgi:uncharacterized membrane protein